MTFKVGTAVSAISREIAGCIPVEVMVVVVKRVLSSFSKTGFSFSKNLEQSSIVAVGRPYRRGVASRHLALNDVTQM